MERVRDIAHLSAVELRTPDLDATVDFFVRLMSLDEVHREDGVVHLHCWDGYERFTVRVVAHETSGIGRTWLRASGPAALERRAAALGERGRVGVWEDGEVGLGRTYVVPDPDGHLIARRLDHVNFLASDVPANRAFLADALGARLSEDILRAAHVFLENDVFIETGPHKHAVQQTFFLHVYEPGGNRVELCNAGARLLLSADAPPVTWTEAERSKGQAWGLQTIESVHTDGTPPVDEG